MKAKRKPSTKKPAKAAVLPFRVVPIIPSDLMPRRFATHEEALQYAEDAGLHYDAESLILHNSDDPDGTAKCEHYWP